MLEQFVNKYPITKTLRFSLIPVGKTEENIVSKKLLEEDRIRSEEYPKVKKLIDRYHREFIEKSLSGFVTDGVKEYAELYYKKDKSEEEKAKMTALEESMRKSIAKRLTGQSNYNSLFGKDIIRTILPEYLTDEEEKASVRMFSDFTTYFVGFFQNRENLYSAEAKSTAIGFRCVNENLPKFLDNAKSFERIRVRLPSETLKKLENDYYSLYGIYPADIFSIDYFSFVLSQSGIDKYNGIIGGYTCSDGTKIQGINEYINLYNQQNAKNDKSKKLPFLKPLYKQILSDIGSISFIPDAFASDDEVLGSIDKAYNETFVDVIMKLSALFKNFADYNLNGIYLRSGVSVTDISNAVFGEWSAVQKSWEEEYERKNPLKPEKNAEKYYEAESKAYKKAESFSLSDIQRLGAQRKAEKCIGNVAEYYEAAVKEKVQQTFSAYDNAKHLFAPGHAEKSKKKLLADKEATESIKTLLDSIKDLQRLVKPLLGTGKEEDKDEVFYGQFLPLIEPLFEIDSLYDKVRNYLTRKPYSKDKIKLNFDNPQLLGGWDKNKEKDYRSVLLMKDGMYYLGIMDKSCPKVFEQAPQSEDKAPCYKKIEYKLLPGPNKMLPKVFFAKSNIEYFNPSDEILRIKREESFKKGANFNIDDCRSIIDFFKASIEKHEDWSQFGFKFSDTESYRDISEFYSEISKQGYYIRFVDVPQDYIDDCINSGKLYLFQIYNKDFSEFSKGTPNMHTLYFRMLFDERNLADVVYKLNGEAEMFYRDASINEKEKTVHPANRPIDNKNPLNPKKQSSFGYDIIKDRRFTKRQFALHVPITLNFKADKQNIINSDVRLALKNNDRMQYVIGIDRGERNLIYISVVGDDGKIVEQHSLNEIISDNDHTVDYRKLLDSKEKERDAARKSWGTVEKIKDLKEGYLSQAVHKICELVLKYDAVIVMEDLNFGFKRGRFGVEKQVYQKFENMLISKLNYLCDKKADPESTGGLLHAYQLTNKSDGVNKAKQNGIIFYVPAWLTSKIDPITGFADLLKPKYISVAQSKELFGNMTDIRYNSSVDLFEFDIDYSLLPRCNADYRKKWTVCTNGERIRTFRNPEKNGEWDSETVTLTDKFKALFECRGIDYRSDLKEQITKQSDAGFFKELIYYFALTLQMRNSRTGSTAAEDDYLISPVRNADGEFFDSRNYSGKSAALPVDADANGAYNIARKGIWAIEQIKNASDDSIDKINLAISNAEWLEFVQS